MQKSHYFHFVFILCTAASSASEFDDYAYTNTTDSDFNITLIHAEANNIYTNDSYTRYKDGNLVVGFHYPEVGGYCASSLSRLLRCDLVNVQVAIFWIRMLAPFNDRIIIKFYAEDKFRQLINDLEYGLVDV